MKPQRLLLLVLVFLLIPAAMVSAGSSANFVVPRYVVVSGGAAGSANYAVTSVVGQPATDVGQSTNYRVSGGFLFPAPSGLGYRTWLPLVVK